MDNNQNNPKLPPQNIDAEQSLLGSLMMDKDGMLKVADFLSADDFYKRNHQYIFEAMLDLYTKSEPIDILSLTNRLKEKNKIDEVGGGDYLSSLVNTVPTSAHLVHYGKIIQNNSTLRKLIAAAADITKICFEEADDMDKLLDNAEQALFRVSQKHITQKFSPIRDTLTEAIERIDRLHKGDGATRGVKTGFTDLDNTLAGLQKSDLVILAARPSLGKTSLALDMVKNIAIKEKVAVGIFSLEMSKEQLVDRMICSIAQVDLWKLRTGKLSYHGENSDFEKINKAYSALSDAPIYIDDGLSSNVLQMRTMARRLQMEHGLGLIVIDYLQLIQGRGGDNRVQEISEISRSLKALARELNVPVLALSQLSRAVESRDNQIPRLSDLRESGSIEQDADVVMFIYREDRVKKNCERPNIAEVIIAKHRNGPLGKAELYFEESQASFKNLAKEFA